MEEFVMNSCVRGHHIFKNVWAPYVGETLTCTPEFGNVHDMYAVAVVTQPRDGERTVGHVPRKISYVCHLFLRRGGYIVCRVTNRRRVTTDLPQGGLEVPCLYTFIGTSKEIEKVKKLTSIAPDSAIVDPTSAVEPPSKKSKIDNTAQASPDQPLQQSQGIWLTFGSQILTKSDENDITSLEKLNDHHINFAHKLLANQFPSIEGLGYTIIQNKPPIKKILNGLQIIFDRGDHWIVASSIGCTERHIVHVYDSLYSTVNENTKKVILNLFDESKTSIVPISVQRQAGGNDCGLFAIANATSVLFGGDVAKLRFKQHEMRTHLYDCFVANALMPIPLE